MSAASPAWLQALGSHLAAHGLDRLGVADGAPHGAVLAGCRSVVVVGNGGRALWEGLLAAVRAEPALAEAPHPLDAYVARVLAEAPVPVPGRWVACAAESPVPLDFRTLGLHAGLGWPSRLGLLLHPEAGPWLGLRAAFFTPVALAPTGPLPGAGPCPTCPAPCMPACPIGAVGPEGVDWRASWAFRQRDDRCHGGCLAREACPEGRDHAYGAAQHRYHQHPPSRAALLISEAARAPDRPS